MASPSLGYSEPSRTQPWVACSWARVGLGDFQRCPPASAALGHRELKGMCCLKSFLGVRHLLWKLCSYRNDRAGHPHRLPCPHKADRLLSELKRRSRLSFHDNRHYSMAYICPQCLPLCNLGLSSLYQFTEGDAKSIALTVTEIQFEMDEWKMLCKCWVLLLLGEVKKSCGVLHTHWCSLWVLNTWKKLSLSPYFSSLSGLCCVTPFLKCPLISKYSLQAAALVW